MVSDITFTGERFVPGCAGEIAYEHWHRYAFARRFAAAKRVLDAACGEGYGSALLGAVAESVVGVDIDVSAIAHAGERYGEGDRVRFIAGSCAALPLPDASVDAVVSFETIEHLDAADQPKMLAEFARVLKPEGLLIISSPNKRLYSDAREYVNEFHRHELYRDGLAALLAASFPAQSWYHQRVAPWSAIWPEHPMDGAEAWLGDGSGITSYKPPEGMYFVVVAGRSANAVLPIAPGSLFTDADDTELKRNEWNAREVLRLDALLREHNAVLDRQTAHIQHLEAMVAERERIIGDMDRRLHELNAAREAWDRQLAERTQTIAALASRIATLESRVAALDVEQNRLHAALHASEVTVAYRQSARWWVKLPWFRVKLWLARTR
jgi:ubiquinone/menaquinone biosynthesis C-methylase UbiE